MTRQYYDSQGKAYRLGAKLGSGAEGDAFDVESQAGLVAKLYSSGVAPARIEKISVMAAGATPSLEKFVAWPLDNLRDSPGGRVVGFLMRKADGRQLHDLYGPKSRIQYFPSAGWKFLIAAAANLARAVAAVNAHGHAVGDLNQRNVHVDGRAVVTILDADSFEVCAGGKQFHCGVGVDSHTPPELQGVSLGTVVRTPDHDAFALAVSVFQLLFLGRHPFAGLSLDGDLSIAEAIKQRKYAYGPNAASRRMKPPVGTPSVDIVPGELATMFERAFTNTGARPTAAEWAEALQRLYGSLTVCAAHSGHQYRSGLASCPWCALEIQTAVMFWVAPILGQLPNFDLAAIWADIVAVDPPAPPAPPKQQTPSPSLSAVAARKRVVSVRTSVAVLALVVGTGIALNSPVGAAKSFGLAGPGAAGAAQAWLWAIAASVVLICTYGLCVFERQLRLPFAAVLAVHRKTLAGIAPTDLTAHLTSKFWEIRAELARFRDEYERLPEIRARRLSELSNTARQRALDVFLDRHRIIASTIPNIGSSRKATLLSYGIETALDVDARRIESIPGFGPTLASYLVLWRRDVERGFVFDASKYDDSADRQRVEQEERAREMRLRSALSSGPGQLRSISEGVSRQVKLTANRRVEVEADLEQARVDVETFPDRTWLAAGSIASVVGIAMLQASLYGARLSGTTTAVPPPAQPVVATPAPQNQPAAPTAQEHYERGLLAVTQRRFPDAAAELRQAVALDAKRADAWHELGYALYKLGQFDESASASTRSVEIDATSADTFRNLGLAYSSLLQWDKAVAAFEKAAALEPKVPKHFVSLAIANRKLGNDAASRKAIDSALALDPDLPEAHLELGRLFLHENDIDGASNQLAVLESSDPKRAGQLRSEIAKAGDSRRLSPTDDPGTTMLP